MQFYAIFKHFQWLAFFKFVYDKVNVHQSNKGLKCNKILLSISCLYCNNIKNTFTILDSMWSDACIDFQP